MVCPERAMNELAEELLGVYITPLRKKTGATTEAIFPSALHLCVLRHRCSPVVSTSVRPRPIGPEYLSALCEQIVEDKSSKPSPLSPGR